MQPRFTIVICTYNPENRILQKCLDSIAQLANSSWAEVLIIDNNSTQSVSDLLFVQNFLNHHTNSKVLLEKKQGLTFARIFGIQNAKAEWIVFVDDDNVLAPDYLREACNLVNLFPKVGVWGPGKITPRFIDQTPRWVLKNLKSLYQEKDVAQYETTDQIALWENCYPPGTGQIVRRDILDIYAEKFLNGELTMSDRKGGQLSSSGDSQIIWTALQLGYHVGHTPMLAVEHIIPAKRVQFDYIKRIVFSLNFSGIVAFSEFFPEKKIDLPKFDATNLYSTITKSYIKYLLSGGYRNYLIVAFSMIGYYAGLCHVEGKKLPVTIKRLIKFHNLN